MIEMPSIKEIVWLCSTLLMLFLSYIFGVMAQRRETTFEYLEASYKRHLHYLEKHSGWHIFRGVFWGIYLFIIGLLLATVVPGTLTYPAFFGWSLIILSFFVVIYGFTTSMHHRLMKKYA